MILCSLYEGCSNPAVIQWKRFLTDAELAAAQAANPESNITAQNSYTAVYGCIDHQLTTDLVVLTHQNTCTAPDTNYLPACNCTPVNTSAPAPQSVQA